MISSSTVDDLDGCGLVLRCHVQGRSTYLFAHRADSPEYDAAARSLTSSGFAVVDHFLGAPLALRLREGGLAMYSQRPGAFKTGAVGGGHDGEGQAYSSAKVRGDRMTIIQDHGSLPVLGHLLGKFDKLLHHLSVHGGGRCGERW